MLRVSVLSPMPSPYMRDLFDAMMADGRIDLRVHYLEMEAPDTHWGQVPLPDYAEVLPGGWFWLGGGRIHHNRGALRRILKHQPDVVVVQGYSGITHQVVMRGLRRLQIPWIFFGERPGMQRRGRLGRTLRALAQRPAVKWPNAIVAIGSAAQRSYSSMTRTSIPVENIPYCCDLAGFRTTRAVRSKRAVNFLYCGQLIHRKGVDLLLAAFLQIADRYSDCRLTLVGDGPLRAELECQVPAAHSDRVVFAGFRPVNELPAWFGVADVFVLPSRHDGWGVVVNQAVGAGLAIICSDAVGAAEDLVQPNVNGMIFPSDDQGALVRCLETLAGSPELSATMGARSQQLAESIIPAAAAIRWYSLCQRIVGRVSQNVELDAEVASVHA